MNSFGRIFRVTIFGESHGPMVGISMDGCPAGLPLAEEDFATDLERRKGGLQKGTTPRKEDDKPIFITGYFNGKTTGAPLTILFENKNTRSGDYDKIKSIPRPGHADFVAHEKFAKNEDYRGGGHFSGRLTVCLVAAGVIAKKILNGPLQTSPNGGGLANTQPLRNQDSNNQLATSISEVSAADFPPLEEPKGAFSIEATITEIGGEKDIGAGLQKAIDAKDSVGGIVECTVKGLPIGLGEPFFDSVESVISHVVFSIPAIKGIEFGAGFQGAKMFGSDHNDAIVDASGKTETNHAGGVVGGISNGNDLVFRVVVKPTSSTPKEQESWNWETEQVEKFSVKGRHDLCIALRVPPVLEAVTAIALADLMLLEQKIKRVV
jgi:chorismate synthase